MSAAPTSGLGSVIAGVVRLDGPSTWSNWDFALGIALRHLGAYETTVGLKTKPDPGAGATKADIAAWEKEAKDGLTAIGLTVDVSQYVHIRDCEDGPKAYAALKAVYAKKSRAARTVLKKALYSYEHDITLPIQSYISGIVNLASQLKAIGVTMDDDDVIDVLIFQLDASWASVAEVLLARETMTIADAKGILAASESFRGLAPTVGGGESALVGAQGGNKGTRRKEEKKDHSHIVCWRCDKKGHTAFLCPTRPRTDDDEANVAATAVITDSNRVFAF